MVEVRIIHNDPSFSFSQSRFSFFHLFQLVTQCNSMLMVLNISVCRCFILILWYFRILHFIIFCDIIKLVIFCQSSCSSLLSPLDISLRLIYPIFIKNVSDIQLDQLAISYDNKMFVYVDVLGDDNCIRVSSVKD